MKEDNPCKVPILLDTRAEYVGLMGQDKYMRILIQAHKIPMSVFETRKF